MMRRLLALLLGAGLSLAGPPALPADDAAVPSFRWDGPIGPVAAEYIETRLARAAGSGAPLVILGLDTPGGLDTSMRDIVRAIQASPIPVAVWVGPSGSRAASAGCVIGLAAHLLVMAPGTNIGAAHPVTVGGGAPDSTMNAKMVADAEAYIVSLARHRQRNETWAREAVTKSVSAAADEAVRLGVADFVAADLEALLAAAHGRTVDTIGGPRALDTANARLERLERDWRTDLLAFIGDPNVAYILLLLGIYGLFFEMANPGALFPGIFGAIALILGLYGLSNLPLSGAGLLLLLAGIAMLLLEIKITSHGLLTVGGVAALLAGSLLLLDTPLPFFRVSLAVILPAVAVTALFFGILVGKGLLAQKRRPVTGPEALVGRTAIVRERLAPSGAVFVDGTHWSARLEGAEGAEPGEAVRIVGVDDLRLRVRRSESTQT
jgi:membrane-bound serine protease (ClpP class)